MTLSGLKIFGLTGGIASGKSTVGVYFSELGIPVIDADEIARDLRAPGGEAFDTIEKRFGTVESAKLREKIFSDPTAKGDLEKIMHPLIQKKSEEEFEKYRGRAPYVIYEAALLVETGRHRDLAGLIVVSLSPELQLERLMKRDRVSEAVARQMIDAQSATSLKESQATHRILNEGSLDDLKKQVRNLHPQFLA